MNTTSNGYIFEQIDPLGRKIVLKSSTWDEHIKDRHEEKDIICIAKNIRKPNIIIKNNKETTSTAERHIYMGYTTCDNKLYNIKTVVEFKPLSGHGEVVTNYILRKINENILEGGIIYDSSED